MFPALSSYRICSVCEFVGSSPLLLRTCHSLSLDSPLFPTLVSSNPLLVCNLSLLLAFSIPPFSLISLSITYTFFLFAAIVLFFTNALVSLKTSLVKSLQAFPNRDIISGSAI